jgi:Phage major capsid protein E
MASLDVFSQDAFGVVQLTDSINKMKFVPGFLGQMGIFMESPVSQTTIMIEEMNGLLSLVSPSPRGGPGATEDKVRRSARALVVPHFERDDAINADEVQGVRAFGSETETETIQGKLADRLQIHSQALAATQEYSRIGAIKGVVTYADSSTLNLFTEFGVGANSEAFLDLEAGSPTDGVLRKLIAGAVRTIANGLEGTPYSSIWALCGDTFFDDLTNHPDVVETFKNWNAAQDLRAGFVQAVNGAFSAPFPFGGVNWVNYRGSVGGTDYIDADLAYGFPASPGLFRTYYAPADYIETVNTMGQRLYARQYEAPNGKRVNLEVQMNALDICTRPGALLKFSNAAS